MIELLNAEYIKHKKKIFVIFMLLFLLDFFCIIITIQNISNEKFKFDIFSIYYSSYSIVFMISYLTISLFGLYLFYYEFKNNMIKQLFTTSITNIEFIISKLFFVFLFSEISMILYMIQLIIVSLVKHVSFEINNLIFIILLSIFDAFLLFLAILPLVALFIYLKDNVIVSLLGIVIYALMVILASLQVVHIDNLSYLHPLTDIVLIHNYFLFSHIPIKDYGILEAAIENINILLAFISIIIYSIISIGIIIHIVKKIRK